MTFATGLRCVACGATYPLAPMFEGCPACATADFRSGLTTEYDYAALASELGDSGLVEPGVQGIWRYRRLLPVRDSAHQVSLGEGGTALIPMPTLTDELGAIEVWLKDESRNPTWSFKDRNAAVTVARALDFGARAIVASSSGNHGVAVAAYAARAGLPCLILTYPGLPEAVRAAIQAFGAELVVTSREGRWTLLREGVAEHGWFPATNYTTIPTNGAYGHDGYKTIAYEIFDQLGGCVPDLVAVPTSYGEGLFGIWKGFDELRRLGRSTRIPRMVGCEPAGGPLAAALEDVRGIATVAAQPTVARGIGGTTSSFVAIATIRASDGLVGQATDQEILEAQLDLAAQGILCEPASAAALAGMRAVHRRGELPRRQRVVLVSTSGGLKNIAALADRMPMPRQVEPMEGAVRDLLRNGFAPAMRP